MDSFALLLIALTIFLKCSTVEVSFQLMLAEYLKKIVFAFCFLIKLKFVVFISSGKAFIFVPVMGK